MASGGRLSPGGSSGRVEVNGDEMSYGRASAVFLWVSSNWREFDAWCCIKGIDPLELPAYRFYNLALFRIKEGMDEEQLKDLEQTFKILDSVKHPLQDLQPTERLARDSNIPSAPSPEERHTYIPPWWKGEQAAAKIATAAMQGVNTLPKMQ